MPDDDEPIYVMHPDASRDGEAKSLSADAEGVRRKRDAGLGITTDESFTLAAGTPPSVFQRATQPHGAHGSELDDERWEETDIAPPATVHSADQRLLIAEGPMFVSENQRAELRLTEYARQLTGGGGKAGQGYPAVLMPHEEEDTCEPSPCSQGSEEWTLDSTEPDSRSSPNAKPSHTDDECSPDTGPEFPTGMTFDVWENNLDGTIYRHRDQTPPLKSICSRLWLTSSAEDSPAKTSPSPDDEPDLPASAPDSFSSSHESQTLFSATEDGSSLRTYPDCFPALDEIKKLESTEQDATSPSFSRRWPTSGFTTSPGEHWTADTSECPNGGDASSSLRDVLEVRAPSRFSLSPKAAAGILRRALRRGKALPTALQAALSERAKGHEEDGETTSTTEPTSPAPSAPSGEKEPADPPETSARISSPDDQMTMI